MKNKPNTLNAAMLPAVPTASEQFMVQPSAPKPWECLHIIGKLKPILLCSMMLLMLGSYSSYSQTLYFEDDFSSSSGWSTSANSNGMVIIDNNQIHIKPFYDCSYSYPAANARMYKSLPCTNLLDNISWHAEFDFSYNNVGTAPQCNLFALASDHEQPIVTRNLNGYSCSNTGNPNTSASFSNVNQNEIVVVLDLLNHKLILANKADSTTTQDTNNAIDITNKIVAGTTYHCIVRASVINGTLTCLLYNGTTLLGSVTQTFSPSVTGLAYLIESINSHSGWNRSADVYTDNVKIYIDDQFDFTYTANKYLCSGSSVTLSLNLPSYLTLQEWQYSTDGGATWNTISNSSNMYSLTETLTTTTRYRAKAAYKCNSNFVCYSKEKEIIISSTTNDCAKFTIWTGNANNNNWNDANNWCGGVPTSTKSAVIPYGRSSYPILSGGVDVCNLHVQTDPVNSVHGKITHNSGSNLRIWGDSFIVDSNGADLVVNSGTITIKKSLAIPAETYNVLVLDGKRTDSQVKYVLTGNIVIMNFLYLNDLADGAILECNNYLIYLDGDCKNNGKILGAGGLYVRPQTANLYRQLYTDWSNSTYSAEHAYFETIHINSYEVAGVQTKLTATQTTNNTPATFTVKNIRQTRGEFLVKYDKVDFYFLGELTNDNAGGGRPDECYCKIRMSTPGSTLHLEENLIDGTSSGVIESNFAVNGGNLVVNRLAGVIVRQCSYSGAPGSSNPYIHDLTFTKANSFLDLAGANLNVGTSTSSNPKMDFTACSTCFVKNTSHTQGTLTITGGTSATNILTSNLQLGDMYGLTINIGDGAKGNADVVLANNFDIYGPMNITKGDFDINGHTVSFKGASATLTEKVITGTGQQTVVDGTNGSGKLTISPTLSTTATNKHLGLELSSVNTSNITTTINRYNYAVTGTYCNSIKRHFEVIPSASFTANLKFNFDNDELNGYSSSSDLQFYSSSISGSYSYSSIGRTSVGTLYASLNNCSLTSSGIAYTLASNTNTGTMSPAMASNKNTGNTNSSLTLFPNPFTTELTVTIPAGFIPENNYYEIMDLNGKIICRNTFIVLDNTTIFKLSNLQNLSEGIYLLNIYSASQKYTQKIIKR